MARQAHILVVDDEESIRHLLKRVLVQEGFSVQVAENGDETMAAIQERIPDLVILDYNLPGTSGRKICQDLRRNPATKSIPVIMITGSVKEGLPIECLNAGADDYVTKPFDLKELVARVNAIRRRPRLYEDEKEILEKGLITIQPAERIVKINGKDVQRLTPKEFDLLFHIVLHSPRVLDKNTLALKVWGQTREFLHDRTLDVHIRRIRSKLGPVAASHLLTIPSLGFQWITSR